MTVKELKAALENADDNAEVEIPVRVYTRAYPVAYLPVLDTEPGTRGFRSDGAFRIYVSFPAGTTVSVRKAVR